MSIGNSLELELFSHYGDYDHWSTEPGLYSCVDNGCCLGSIKTEQGYTLICICCGAENQQ